MSWFDSLKKKKWLSFPFAREERDRLLPLVKQTSAPAQTAAVTVARPNELSPEAVQASRVLGQPLVTEKAARAEALGVYTFVVTRQATKGQIRQAIKAVYGVRPRVVRLINVEGKRTMFGRVPGKRSEWKKALVTLPKGQTMRIHEGV